MSLVKPKVILSKVGQGKEEAYSSCVPGKIQRERGRVVKVKRSYKGICRL